MPSSSFEGIGAGDYELRVHFKDRETGSAVQGDKRIQVAGAVDQTVVIVMTQ